jgi:hypothetical protein
MPSGLSTADVTGRFQAGFGAQAEGTDSALLTDGLFSVSSRHAWLETEAPAEEGIVKITLSSQDALPVCGIAIYPGAECLGDISSVGLRLGQKASSEEFVVEEGMTSPLLLYFDTCETDTIEITLSLREGQSVTRLSEISVLSEMN